MFPLLRRWRLVMPLLLALLALCVVSSGIAQAAPATRVLQHFWGRAVALEDDSSVFSDTACDTGSDLPLSGGSLSVGPCTTPVTASTNFGGNRTFGNVHFPAGDNLGYFTVILSMNDGDAGVATHTGLTKGSVTSTAYAYGVSLDSVLITNCPTLGTDQTELEAVTAEFAAAGFDTDADSPVALAITDTATLCVGATTGNHIFEILNLLDTNEVVGSTVATCGRHASGHVSASVTASAQTPYNDLFIDSFDSLRHFSPDGTPNESVSIAPGTIEAGATGVGQPGLSAIAVFNEQYDPTTDGDYAGMSDIGLHLIATNSEGTVIGNFGIAETSAAEHCATHMSKSEPSALPPLPPDAVGN